MAQAQQHSVYGGQAVIEGVMIRGRHVYSVAARHPTGIIKTITRPVPTWSVNRFRRIPFIRGTLVLSESLIVGMRALTWSAQVSSGETEDDEQPIPPLAMALTLATSLVLGIGLFFILPLLITHSLRRPLHRQLHPEQYGGGRPATRRLLCLPHASSASCQASSASSATTPRST